MPTEPAAGGDGAGSGPRKAAATAGRAGGLFAPITTTDELLEATSDAAWVGAMLEVEAALSRAEAAAGIVPPEAAEAIAAACRAAAASPVGRFDPGTLGRAARPGGNPVIPLVEALTAAVPGDAGRWVHWGATSQDVLDSAAMLLSRRGLGIVDRELGGLADGCAVLAERHRDTLMAGRTLLQQALPVTFGLKAAGWLGSVLEARARVRDVVPRLAAELGGAAGTLASLGERGPAVAADLAARLGLAEPLLPWHAARGRIAEVACTLGLVAGTCAKIALDVGLLMQTEVGEAFEPSGPGRGGSSTLPHKRNPVGAAAVSAAARRAHALVALMLGAMAQEHERGVGGWQAEWEALGELLRLAGGAAAQVRETVAGLEVDAERMRANLDLTGGLLLAERVSLTLGATMGRLAAKHAVEEAARRSLRAGRSFLDELQADPAIAGALSPADLRGLLDPRGYLGAAQVFVDRALEAHRSAAEGR